jgi:diguanylate cyclase (GGDEF)-like protein
MATQVGELLALTLANLRMREAMRNQALRDPLTGLYNRRYLDETFQRELSRAARTGGSVGVVVVDVDHFKRVNDTFGHGGGDTVLRELAALLLASFRVNDIVRRYGGEEFVAVLPDCGLEDALRRAPRSTRTGCSTRLEFERPAPQVPAKGSFDDVSSDRDVLRHHCPEEPRDGVEVIVLVLAQDGVVVAALEPAGGDGAAGPRRQALRVVHRDEFVVDGVHHEQGPRVGGQLPSVVEPARACRGEGRRRFTELAWIDPQQETLERIRNAALEDEPCQAWKSGGGLDGEDRPDGAPEDDDTVRLGFHCRDHLPHVLEHPPEQRLARGHPVASVLGEEQVPSERGEPLREAVEVVRDDLAVPVEVDDGGSARGRGVERTSQRRVARFDEERRGEATSAREEVALRDQRVVEDLS